MTGDRRWAVDRLRSRWQADGTLSGSLEAALDAIGFDARFVEGAAPAAGRRKYLKDSVWGMIEFDRPAIQLVDSPLLQRLRSVRQLGFSYLVYPSAEHTRFIHSLGMAHVVSSFLASIRRNADIQIEASTQVAGYRDSSAFAPLTEQELLFAALLHDVGHLPFSHACEAALVENDEPFACGGRPLGEFLAETRHAFGKNVSLSEALSILIVLSARFAEYYRRIASLERDALDPSLVRIACLIAGVPVADRCPNIQSLISAAAVDADKIDYVARDAAACGIAVGVDVSRIFMGSGLVEARRDTYDASYDGDANGIVFVVNASGADTLDEIVQARSALYQRVYLHPVTRTAEALLTRALRGNAIARDGRRNELADALSLWAMDDAVLLREISVHPDASVSGLALRLKRRAMPKKACALAGAVADMHMPLRAVLRRLDATLASSIRKDVANTFIEKLRRERIGEINPAAIEARIKAEVHALADALRRGGRSEFVPSTPLDLVVMTPIAAMDASRPDALVFQAGELISTPALTNVQGQHDAQDIFRAVGYLFCDVDWRALVLVATRRVVLRMSEETEPDLVQHGIEIGTSRVIVSAKRRTILDFEGVARRANVPRSAAEGVLRAAADVAFFDDDPVLYLPTKPDDSGVSAAAAAFRGFAGELGWTVDRTTVAAFVDQLPPRHRPAMLEVLAQGSLLDQAALAECLREAIGRVRQRGEPAVVCPLSASSGGSAITVVRSLELAGIRTCAGLREALDVEGDPLLLFVDDNAASGVQASAQLYAHLGVDRAEWPARLSREDFLFEGELGPDDADRLRRRRSAIVVAVGLDRANEAVTATAGDLGLANFLGVHYGRRIAEGLSWPEELRDYLANIGRELLSNRYAGRPYAELEDAELIKRCDERSFGYGSHGGVMATHSNVPSSTVTALWQPGMINGRPWMPLLIRRGLLKDLVIG